MDLRFSKLAPLANPSTMPYRHDSDAYYGREAPDYSEYRGGLASTPYEPFYGGRYPIESPHREEEDAKPEGRRSAHALRDPNYRYHARSIRGQFDQFGRVARSTSQRGLSVDYPDYQSHAPHHPSFDQFNGRRDCASYYGDRAAAASYHHREFGVPSMIESETSSVENTWDGDHWKGKIADAPVMYSSGRYSEELSDDEDSYANAKKPAARLGSSKLPVTKLALPNTKDCSTSMSTKSIEVSPGHFVRLRGADETWRAITCDFYMPCACVCCSLTLFCIQDACFVLCPDCRVVSPMEGVAFEDFDGGVGLGFKIEELAKWQDDIEREQRFARKK